MSVPSDQPVSSSPHPGDHESPDPARDHATPSSRPTGTAPRSQGRPTRVDPRGPRFGAGITSVLLLVTIALDLQGFRVAALALLAALVVLFAWGTVAGVARHPWGLLFQKAVRPHLAPPSEMEDATPPTFAQAVGLLVTGVGLVLALIGVPHAVVVSAAIAFLAAFLNAAFGLCLGCELYVLLLRAGLVGRGRQRSE